MSRWMAALVVLVVTFGAVLLAIATVDSPEVVAASAPPEVFSAERAMEHVRALAREPHPMGTEAHARVRSYLLGALGDLGVETEVQEAIGRSYRLGNRLGTVQNILARLPGTDPEAPALLLASHYDSVPAGPGAADASSGVAAILETLRALQAGEPLENDVLVLLSDGEEFGLLGAEAFADSHPWAERVGMVLNLEARGTRGPSLMFETGSHNLWLLRTLAAEAPSAVAPSYSYEVYRRLPNDTDYTVFRQRGIPGMNFAFIHGPMGYHTSLDSVERFDPRSLQHHGEQTLALARALGDADLANPPRSGDGVSFNLLGSSLLVYPAAWALPLALILLLGALAVPVLALRRGTLKLGGLLGGLLLQLVVVLLVGGIATLLSGVLFPTTYNFRIWGDGSSIAWTLAGLAVLSAGLTLGLGALLRRFAAPASLAAGGLLLWAILSLVVSLVSPGASYLFAFPLLFQLLAVGYWLLRGTPAPSAARGAATTPAPAGPVAVPLVVLWALAALVTALFWAPTLSMIGVGLQLAAAALVAALVALTLVFLAPQAALVTDLGPRWLMPALLVVGGAVLVLAVHLTSSYGPDNPRSNTLLYAFDADSGEARWASFGPPDAWTGQVLADPPEQAPLSDFLATERPVFQGPAPGLGLPAARVELIGREESGQGVVHRLRVTPGIDAHRTQLRLGAETPILAVTVQGRSAEAVGSPTGAEAPAVRLVDYFVPPRQGLEVVVETAGETLLVVVALDQRFELPATPDGSPGSREPGTMQFGFSWDTDSTLVRTRVEFPEGAQPEAAPASEATEDGAPVEAGEAAAAAAPGAGA